MVMHYSSNSIKGETRNILATWLENHYTELSKALEATPWGIRLKFVDVKVEYSNNSCRVARTPVLVYTPNFQLGAIAPIQGSSREARDALTRLLDIKRKDCLLVNLAREIGSSLSDYNIVLQDHQITRSLVELLTYLFEVDVNSLREPPLLIRYPFKALKIRYKMENSSAILNRLDRVFNKFTARLMLPGNSPVKVTSLIFIRPQELAVSELTDCLVFEDCVVHRVNARTITMAVLAVSGHTLVPSPIPDVDRLSPLRDLCIETTFNVDLQPDPRRWSVYKARCILHNEALRKLRKAVGLLKVYDPDMVIINAIYHIDAIWPDSPGALRMVSRISSGLAPLGGSDLVQPSGVIASSEYALFLSPIRKKRGSWNHVKEAFKKLTGLLRLGDKRLAEALKITLADLAREHETLSIEEKLVQLCRILESVCYIYAYIKEHDIPKSGIDTAKSIIKVLTKHGFELSIQDKKLLEKIYKRRSVLGAHGLKVQRILLGKKENLDFGAEVSSELIKTRNLTCKLLQKLIGDI